MNSFLYTGNGWVVIVYFIITSLFVTWVSSFFPVINNQFSNHALFVQTMLLGLATYFTGMRINYKINENNFYKKPNEFIVSNGKAEKNYFKKMKTNEHKFLFVPIQYIGAFLIISSAINLIRLFVI